MNTAATEAFRSVLGTDANPILRALDLMGVAEQEIARAERGKRGATKATIHDSFRLLAPGVLLNLTEDVYRHHCREIIGRVIRGEDARPATKAEVMAHISRASLEAPPRHEYASLMLFLVNEILPKSNQPVEGHFAAVRQEERDELLAELRHTCRNEQRDVRAVLTGETPKKMRRTR